MVNITNEDKLREALEGNYTPLINAIIKRDVEQVRTLVENGADVNEMDNEFRWKPLKWMQFVYEYAPGREDYDEQEKIHDILRILLNARAYADYDSFVREDSYNFYPVVIEDIESDEEMGDIINREGGKRNSKKSQKKRRNKKSKKLNKSKKIKKTNKRRYLKKK